MIKRIPLALHQLDLNWTSVPFNADGDPVIKVK